MDKRKFIKLIGVAVATSGLGTTAQATKKAEKGSRRYENPGVSADDEKALREYAVWLLTLPQAEQETIVASLPQAKTDAVVDAFRPADIEQAVESVEPVMADTNSGLEFGTQSVTVRVTYSATLKNTVGLAVATLYHAVDWSYDGTIISSASSEAWGTAGGLGWNYEGITDSFTSGGAGEQFYDSFKKGLFRYCPYSYCIDEKTAEIYILVDDEGRDRAEGGPNLRRR